MKSYVSNLIISSFVFTIFILIIPSGKMTKSVKTTIGLILIILVFSPLVKLKNIDINMNDFIFKDDIEIQTNFIEYVYQEKAKSLENNCENISKELGVSNAEFSVVYAINVENQFEVEYIEINLKNAVINSEIEHINIIEKVKKNISEYLDIDYKNVVVYE
ncbi:MAG: stage III sporulation protein AF [Clostridia bacterium]|nr:stage III sporulation protein AF [Clostridia bacterium]